jgi:uncharacterized membrane protein
MRQFPWTGARMNYWPLIGVAVVLVGFALKRNAVLVVVAAGVASALAAGMSMGDLLALLGDSFVANRALLLFTLTLPVIGLLERYGLRERARAWVEGFEGLSLARLLIAYLGLRQLLAMFGLIDLGGHAQTVRPLLAPMSEAAAERAAAMPVASEQATRDAADAAHAALPADERARVRALAAATDNVGRFFGEDVFVAFGAVLLIQGFYERNGIHLEPLEIALWALPTAIAAFVIHALRIVAAQRALRARAAPRVAAGSYEEISR